MLSAQHIVDIKKQEGDFSFFVCTITSESSTQFPLRAQLNVNEPRPQGPRAPRPRDEGPPHWTALVWTTFRAAPKVMGRD